MVWRTRTEPGLRKGNQCSSRLPHLSSPLFGQTGSPRITLAGLELTMQIRLTLKSERAYYCLCLLRAEARGVCHRRHETSWAHSPRVCRTQASSVDPKRHLRLTSLPCRPSSHCSFVSLLPQGTPFLHSTARGQRTAAPALSFSLFLIF